MHVNLFALAALLGLAVGFDLHTRRIPNCLVGVGILAGFSFSVGVWWSGTVHAMVPSTPLAAVAGLLTGFLLFLPFHLLRVLGAGDVKLMAMVGVWLGPAATLQATVYVLLAGGVLALAMACWTGRLRRVLRNVLHMIVSRTAPALPMARADSSSAPAETARLTGRLPYAVAVAAGTAVQVMLTLTTPLR
jgi:prepilin peptidase CpaA